MRATGLTTGVVKPSVGLYYEGNAKSVCVAGDFNGWDSKKDCMTRVEDKWEVILSLEPGYYTYSFCVNGSVYCPDGNALLQTDDGFGGIVSILVVE